MTDMRKKGANEQRGGGVKEEKERGERERKKGERDLEA
jgi:hypothetical protein